jgi:GT2 family glycosyltransferase
MKKVSVIVPVYNAPDVVSRLLESIQVNTNWELVDTVLIGDDNSDELTASVIEQFSQRCPSIIHLRRQQNLGFLQNVNDMFERCKTEYIILLNSDVIVPPTWIERTVAALESESNVALACPLTTNATNLVLKPAPGQSWQDVDQILSKIPPQYPDCRPVVGFFLAIKRAVLGNEPLLDPSYGNGYWEDTDLHFRVTTRGNRAVVIDNLFIFHQHESPSFSLENDLPAINDTNKKLFMGKWEQQFRRMNELNAEFDHTKRLRVQGSTQFRYYQQSDRDVLFVLPTVKAGIGGVDVVLKLVDSLNLCGIRASTYCYGEVDWSFVHRKYQHAPLTELDDVFETIAHIDAVFATSHGSFEKARKLAAFYDAKLCYFVQGPEVAFESGRHGRQVSLDYQEADAIVTVSSHLTKYVESFGVKATTISMGPSLHEFYPVSNANRDMRAIAACLRNDMKGTGVLVANLLAAKAAGFSLHLFGASRKWDICSGATWHGFLTPKETRKLFSRVGYYMDCSYMEGLGLLPLEAAFCGCIPILAREQGLKGIIERDVSYLALPEDFPGPQFFETLHSVPKQHLQTGLTEVRSRVSHERGVEEFVAVVRRIQSGRSVASASTKTFEWVGKAPSQKRPAEKENTKALARLTKERDALRAERDAILGSTSWKLSAPVRLAGEALGKMRSGMSK